MVSKVNASEGTVWICSKETLCKEFPGKLLCFSDEQIEHLGLSGGGKWSNIQGVLSLLYFTQLQFVNQVKLIRYLRGST